MRRHSPLARPIATLTTTAPDEAEHASTGLDRPGDRLEGDREQDEAGAVVEQALAVDDRREGGRDAERLERRDDRRRVRGGDHRADDERELEPGARRPRFRTIATTTAEIRTPGTASSSEARRPPPKLVESEPIAGLEHEAGQRGR